jgi:aspartate/methionine/tyrosine aminotransferase
MADFYKYNFNVDVDYNTEILPLMGSKEGIMHISMAFLNEGDEVLIPNPGYPTYASVTELVQAKARYYDLSADTNWQPNFEVLEKLNLSKVKLMWVSYPHMPTGANGTLELFEKLIAFGKKHRILIVNDNPYSFVLNENPISIFQVEGAKEMALELNSLSKTYNMAGWRVGMVLGNSKLITAVLKVKSNMDSGMFYGIQKGAIEALQLGKDWFEKQNEVYTKRRNLIFQLAEKLNCTYDKNSVGLFVWAKLPNEVKSAEAFIDSVLIDKHIFITPGTIFGTNGEGYIRFSLCVNEEKILQAINRF